MHTADHRCRLMAWTIGGACKPRPPTCTSTSYGVGLVPAQGGLELVDDSAAGKACPWTSIDERRSDHAKHQDSGFARRRQCISQLPLRRCQLSALSDWATGRLGDWFRLGVFDKRRPYRQPPRAPVRWLDGNLRKRPRSCYTQPRQSRASVVGAKRRHRHNTRPEEIR